MDSIAYAWRSTVEVTVRVWSSVKLIVLLCLPFGLTSVELVTMLFLAVRKRFCYNGTFLLVFVSLFICLFVFWGFLFWMVGWLLFFVWVYSPLFPLRVAEVLKLCVNDIWRIHMTIVSFETWCTLITHIAENEVISLVLTFLQQDIWAFY